MHQLLDTDVFKPICNIINRRISTKKVAIKLEFSFKFYLRQNHSAIIGIACDHILCLTILEFYSQVKRKRKFCSNLILIYSRKSTIYCITYVFKYTRCLKILYLILFCKVLF